MLLAPTPDLPDDTEIKDVQLPITIGLVLKNAGIRTVGEYANLPMPTYAGIRASDGDVSLTFGRRWAAHSACRAGLKAKEGTL